MAVERVKKHRSQNGRSWCVTFEHPFRKEAGGEKGQTVRVGLNTNHDDEAEKLRRQLQDLLGDETFATPKAKMKAKTLFDDRVVSAVYEEEDFPPAERVYNSRLPFPSEAGYANVQIIGEKGTGKTELLRQLLGLKMETEPFPPERTRYETEWLFADGELYEAVVTFVPFQKVKQHVETVILQAAIAYAFDSSEQKMAAALMDGAVPLRSLIGSLPCSVAPLYGWTAEVYDEVHMNRWERYIKAIQHEGLRLRQQAAVSSSHDPLAAFQELWKRDPRCQQIADVLLQEMEGMFSMLEEGEITYHTDDWPRCWHVQTNDRAYFLQLLAERFGDNPAFDGKQLSSLVEGIRLKGPFQPLFHDRHRPKLMIKKQSVQNGQLSFQQIQEMTAADAVIVTEKDGAFTASSLLSEMAVNGQAHKLHVVFANPDNLTGERLQTYEQKGHYLLRSLHDHIESIGCSLGEHAARTLTRVCKQNGVYVTERSSPLQSTQSLKKLLLALEKSTIPKQESSVHPIYVSAAVSLAIHEGAERFHEQIERKEDLAATFAFCMAEALYRFFLQQPSGWSRPESSYLEKDWTIERICFFLHQDVLAYAEKEVLSFIKEEDMPWREALQHAVPTEKALFIQKPFLHHIYAIVKGSIERAGGIVIS